jgi:hypothetical protein
MGVCVSTHVPSSSCSPTELASRFGVARILVSYFVALTVPTVFLIPFYWMSGLRQEPGVFPGPSRACLTLRSNRAVLHIRAGSVRHLPRMCLPLAGMHVKGPSMSAHLLLQSLSQIMPSEELASLVFSLVFSFFALTAGFLL